ncbi:MAG: pilin [Patescibacteria group bacterium]
MYKNKKNLSLGFLIAGLLFFTPLFAHAQGYNYQLLEKIPGINTNGDISSYVESIYNVALVLTVLSAVFMLTVGGFMYLTSAGNTSRLGSAKNIIFDSIFGLVLALVAWLILNTINPDLVRLTINGLSATPQSQQAGSGGGTSPVTGKPIVPPTLTAQNAASTILSTSNINAAGSGSCKSAGGPVTPRGNLQDVAAGNAMDLCFKGCNSGSANCAQNGINPSETMLNAMIAVANTGLGFTITSLSGGSHAAKSNHYSGRGADIVPSNGWQATLDSFKRAGALSSSFCESSSGANVNCTTGSPDHIHLDFP